MDNITRFTTNIKALQQYVARENHANVPTHHIEIIEGSEVKLGAFVSYARQRYRKNSLKPDRVTALEAITGWTWGPLKPGPRSNSERNVAITAEYRDGQSLADIAEKYHLSRQRVHQIIRQPKTHVGV
jgi:Mor family transcriptional regulator